MTAKQESRFKTAIYTGATSLLVALTIWLVTQLVGEWSLYGQMKQTPARCDSADRRIMKLQDVTYGLRKEYDTHAQVQAEQVNELKKDVEDIRNMVRDMWLKQK